MSWKSLFYATAFVASLCLPHSPMGALAQSLPDLPEDNAALNNTPEDNSAVGRSMKDNSAEMGVAGISRESGTLDEPGALVEYGRTHRDFRTVLGYATDRINDKEIANIMNKAREIGKKLAVCYDNREVSEFLSVMMEQE